MKWKPMRIAAVLFILATFTSSIVSGTLAKYTVSDVLDNQAHVAKWGITVFSQGDLYGKAYDGAPANSIMQNADGSVTVRSYNAATLGSNVVAPGTKNTTGLAFGISGVAETALKIDVTIKNQNIVLRQNEYFILHKIPETITAENFATVQANYGAIYTATADTYTKCDGYVGETTYYTVYNQVALTKNYYPVVYEIEPTDDVHGLKATHAGIKGYHGSELAIGINNDSLDIISYFLQSFALDAGEVWPDMGAKNVYERSISKVFAAGTDLQSISAFYSDGVYDCMTSEKLTWSWNYQQSVNTSLYNDADNILGRLSAEKIYGPLEDDIVVMTGGANTLIRPTEYIDYCLDTSFDIQMTVSQID